MSGLYLLILENSLKTQIQARALDMAKTLSQMPSISEAFETSNPSEALQPIAEKARKQSGAQYVVIGSTDSIRYAHPDPNKIGKPMVGGDNERALEKGEAYVSEAVGTLGAAIRGKAPGPSRKWRNRRDHLGWFFKRKYSGCRLSISDEIHIFIGIRRADGGFRGCLYFPQCKEIHFRP